MLDRIAIEILYGGGCLTFGDVYHYTKENNINRETFRNDLIDYIKSNESFNGDYTDKFLTDQLKYWFQDLEQ